MAHDNNVEWAGLRHDSRDTLYRTPGGAVPAGTPVAIRFRTFHNDVTRVEMRLYDINANAQQILNMSLAASDVSCYQAGLENDTCDFWSATAARQCSRQYMVPLHHHGRHQDGLLCRQHPRPGWGPRQSQ